MTLLKKCFSFSRYSCQHCGGRLQAKIAVMLGLVVFGGVLVFLLGPIFQIISFPAVLLVVYLGVIYPLSCLVPFEVRHS